MEDKSKNESGKKKPIDKKKIIAISAAILAVIIFAIVFALLRQPTLFGVPTLTVETPQKINMQNNKFVTVDLSVSSLGDALYPAMSVSLNFDSSRLEFMGVEEGNVFILNDKSTEKSGQKLPEWSCNVQKSNETGKINIMYLDMTGGKYAFSRNLLSEGNNVLLRLKFRLKGSIRSGDIMDLTVEDAVFAASDETQSLAMTTDTLKVRNGKIVIGE